MLLTIFSREVYKTESICTCFRAVNILPNRFMGVVGEHQFDVEALSLSHDRHWLLSCSHDQHIKFWDVQDVLKEKVNAKKKAKHSTKSKRLNTSQKTDFFSGLAEEEQQQNSGSGDSDDGSDDSDDDSGSEESE